MENAKGELIQLELKYCERCGGLWLRPHGSDLVFCQRCSTAVVGLFSRTFEPPPLSDRPSVQSGDESAFWIEGGNA